MRPRITAVAAITAFFSAMTVLAPIVVAEPQPKQDDAGPNTKDRGNGDGSKQPKAGQPNGVKGNGSTPNANIQKHLPSGGNRDDNAGGQNGSMPPVKNSPVLKAPPMNPAVINGGDKSSPPVKTFKNLTDTPSVGVKSPKPDRQNPIIVNPTTQYKLPSDKPPTGVKTQNRDKTKPVIVNPTTQNNPSLEKEPNTPGAAKTFKAPSSGPGWSTTTKTPRPLDSQPQGNTAARNAVKSFDEVKRTRTEKSFGDGKETVIEEADKRRIFKSGNTVVIQHDETERLRRVAPNARFERGNGGGNISIIERPGNVRIYNETDANGQLVRRYRRGPDGRDVIIIDNRRRKHNYGKDIAIGVGIIAGAAILNSFVDVPPPRVRIPRERYIVDYERASDDDVYEALSAPPIEDVREGYSLDEIRATVALRDRMRRVDLDDINFEFGSFEVDPSQYGKLDRIARAMQRVIDRNPNEVFMIEGYTDAVGSREDNLSLSDRRAESVAEVLTRQFRIPYENLTTQGYGEDFLKIQTEAPERVNRRVAVRRITPLLSNNDRRPPPPPGNARDSAYDDNGPPPDDRQDDTYDQSGEYRDGGSQSDDGRGDRPPGPDDQGGRDDRGGDGGYQYSPYRNGDRPN